MKRHGSRVLVTRAAHQQAAFCRRIEALDLVAVSFPCIAIEALPWQLEPDAVKNHDLVLFTSANAVDAFHARSPLPVHNARVEAIGPATATRLEEFGQTLSARPIAPFNSEVWLESFNRNTRARSVLIVTGAQGRGLLIDQLQRARVKVSTLEVYKRTLPTVIAADRVRALINEPPHIISITSDAILRNFVTLAGDTITAMRRLPLVVNSERAADLAAEYGFIVPPYIASPPGDEGQLECLAMWMAQE